MSEIRQLAGQTLLYGLSTVVPRLLNWLLVPYYTYNFVAAEYGVVTELYAYMTFLIIILTYGMETAFFRFYKQNDETVYSTILKSIAITSVFFVGIVLLFLEPISIVLQYHDFQYYIIIFACILGLDALVAVPFAKLRAENRPLKFAYIKIINVLTNIFFNVLFITILPKFDLPYYIYNPSLGVGYIFISNLIASFVTLLLLSTEICKAKAKIDFSFLKQALLYGLPLLVAGLAGNINEALDRVILKHLIPDSTQAMQMLGIYGANIKISVLMLLFIQMFKYAFEPYFFKKGDDLAAEVMYARILKYFVIAGLIIFLGINFYLDIVKYFISPAYWEGLRVVPIILFSYLLYGIFVTMSVWYKLKNITRFGAYLTFIGALITISINLLYIPTYGYYASAWARVACYAVMIIFSYLWSRKYMPIQYDVLNIVLYMSVAIIMYYILGAIDFKVNFVAYSVKTVALVSFILFCFKKEKIPFTL